MFGRKINPVKPLIFITLAAIAVVFTDIFILDRGKSIFPQDVPNMTAFFEQLNGDENVQVSALRQKHENYLRNGVRFSGEPSVAAVFPEPIVQERLAVSAAEQMVSFSQIEPAVGIEEDLSAPSKGTLPKSDNFDGIDDLYGAIYEEQANQRTPSNDVAKIRADVARRPEAILNDVVTDKARDIIDPSLSYRYKKPMGGGRIAIIIDDMGLNLRSRLVEILPAPLTLAYLPYAQNLPEQTARAKARGHELMVHLPMEAMNSDLDGGPHVLRVSQSSLELTETLSWGLSQFGGYSGVNNHMGSRLTSDARAMQTVIKDLKKRGLFFIDSRTIGSTVVADVARRNGLPYAERDIFLDHKITPEFIHDALDKLEFLARTQGYAIAIGHPHQETIEALKVWLPTLKNKGLTLVPVSALLHEPVRNNRDLASN